jgi:hypothetical protein
VLLSHRRFLRQQFKALRKRGRLSLFVQAVRSAINDHPGRVVAGLCLVAGVCAGFWLVLR